MLVPSIPGLRLRAATGIAPLVEFMERGRSGGKPRMYRRYVSSSLNESQPVSFLKGDQEERPHRNGLLYLRGITSYVPLSCVRCRFLEERWSRIPDTVFVTCHSQNLSEPMVRGFGPPPSLQGQGGSARIHQICTFLHHSRDQVTCGRNKYL
jgi:hypothetical protein